MLSAANIKLIRSLAHKKYREKHRLFIAEGHKIVEELLNYNRNRESDLYRIKNIYGSPDWIRDNPGFHGPGVEATEVSDNELRKISLLQNPNQVVALVNMPAPLPSPTMIGKDLWLGLDTIQDPGNMGTVIRISDWFGIGHILSSNESVDLFNPKVIQASMGSFLRVKIHYSDMEKTLNAVRKNQDLKIFATAPSGKNIYCEDLPAEGIVLLGNESRGLSPALLRLADEIISIPFFGGGEHPDSLNIATAAAVICSEFRRQMSYSK